MFRYDKPQKGRFRQFHQFGVEILADPSPRADAELIYSAMGFLRMLKIPKLSLLINSVGCSACRSPYLEKLRDAARKADLCEECRDRVDGNCLRIFDCKQEKCRQTVKTLPAITDFLCEDCRNHFSVVRETLQQYDVEFTLDPTLVRGLDYYTKTAFEIVSEQLGAQDALLGGGRYDNLIRELGGADLPAVGFAAGMERIILTLEEVPDLRVKKTMVIYQQPEFLTAAIRVARRFWENGYAALVEYTATKFKKQFQRADRLEADYAVIIGSREVEEHTLSIKDFTTRKQETIKDKDLEKWQRTHL
jgi:histidyl-tRNA synthetase